MKCQVLIDWLTFSVKETDPSKVIQTYLGMDPALFQDTNYSLMGYSKVMRFSDILVCSEGREDDYFKDMGVCVSMSGNGCRTFETMSRLTLDLKDKQGTQSVAFPALFQLLASDADANVSRIDIACDDRAGHLNMDDVLNKVQANELNSRMTTRSTVISFNGQERSGATAYIGAPSSSFRVRIYDKALEQGEPGHWVRVELVMRSRNANAFVGQMTTSENVGKLAAQVINDKFSFIDRDDSNITRCTVCPWWQDFVDELESVRLVAREVIQHTVEQIGSWVEAQVGPSLAILFQTMGWPYIFELAKDSARRLSDKQISLVTDYNSLQIARGVV
jgi:DNA relaxase NicK